MKSTKLMSRKYKDGIMNRHTEDEYMMINAPVYTLFRHEVELWDAHSLPTMYTIVCDYGNGKVNNFLCETLEDAIRVYRLLISID